jgi:hypothetical protein
MLSDRIEAATLSGVAANVSKAVRYILERKVAVPWVQEIEACTTVQRHYRAATKINRDNVFSHDRSFCP